MGAYVANLAAFMTRPLVDITTMEAAASSGMKICAHHVLRTDLERAWPGANFVFDYSGNESFGLLDLYEKGECQALGIQWEGGAVRKDAKLLERLCENDLIFTTALITEIPVAFPIRPQLAHGFSSWMVHAERINDISIKKMVNEFNPAGRGAGVGGASTATGEMHECVIEQADIKHGDKYAQIDINQMALPFMFFMACIILAIIFQLVMVRQGEYTQEGRRNSLRNSLGRHSSLNLMESMRNLVSCAEAGHLPSRQEIEGIQAECGTVIEKSEAPDKGLQMIQEEKPETA